MNSLWESLYDRVKDRRYGTLFLVGLVGSVGLLILGWTLRMAGQDSLRFVVVAGIGLLVFWTSLIVWRVVARREDRPRYSRLSSDELAKARSKLLNRQNGREL